MEQKLVRKILEILEKAYDRSISVENLMKKTRLKNIDGEISQVIKYLKSTEKVTVKLVPEDRMGTKTGRPKLHKWLQRIDEVTITPKGIDFLNELNKLKTDKERNYLISDTTIIVTQIAVLGIVLVIYEKLGLNLFNPSIEMPWALSAITGFVIATFFLLLFYKVINIIFSKESWKGILFSRD